MIDHKHLTAELQFSAQFQTPVIGQSGGIVITWQDDMVKLEDVSTTPHGVYVMVKVIPYFSKWFFLLSRLVLILMIEIGFGTI